MWAWRCDWWRTAELPSSAAPLVSQHPPLQPLCNQCNCCHDSGYPGFCGLWRTSIGLGPTLGSTLHSVWECTGHCQKPSSPASLHTCFLLQTRCGKAPLLASCWRRSEVSSSCTSQACYQLVAVEHAPGFGWEADFLQHCDQEPTQCGELTQCDRCRQTTARQRLLLACATGRDVGGCVHNRQRIERRRKGMHLAKNAV